MAEDPEDDPVGIDRTDPIDRIDRRQLFKGSAALAGLTALAGAIPAGAAPAAPTAPKAPAKPPAAPEGGMRYRQLGKTGPKVSEIGFGGQPVDDPEVVRHAVARGITYFDTSHCYRGGRSEEVIGQGLKGVRHKVVLATKWCPHHIGKAPTKANFLAMLDTSLKRLQTDYIDVLLNHEVGKMSDGQGIPRLRNPELHEAWAVAHKAGKARFMGMSGHDPDLMGVMSWAIDTKRFSVLLGRYSFLDYPNQMSVIDKANANGVGFVAMKTLAGAKGADLDRFRDRYTSFKQAALKWVLSNPRVSNLIISINSKRLVDEYVAASGTRLAEADMAVLERYAAEFATEVCRFDGSCHDACPGGVRIADILRFSMYYHEYKQEGRAVDSYAKLVTAERAAHCAHCAGFCEAACSYDLPIKSLLLKAHKALG